MRCVFVGTGAFLGRVDSETRCAFWSDEPVDHGFDPSRLITIDLALSPNRALAGEIGWDAVQVDDCFTGPTGSVGGTTLGPRWPEIQTSGAVFLEQHFIASLPAHLRPPCPPRNMHGRDYEHKSVLYWPRTNDSRTGKRYSGHHAEILEERGFLAHVAVYPPGTSDLPHVQSSRMWLDLSAADQCDAGPGSLTRIGVGNAPKAGALFLISGSVHEPDET
jgi:hypothetical protein